MSVISRMRQRVRDQFSALAPEELKIIVDMNSTFTKAITAPGCTQEEYQAALHIYLTDPRRTTKVTCYCSTCSEVKNAV